jgi:hypothetical protein
LKNIRKLNTIRERTINNTTKKEREGGSIHLKWHQGRGATPREFREHEEDH